MMNLHYSIAAALGILALSAYQARAADPVRTESTSTLRARTCAVGEQNQSTERYQRAERRRRHRRECWNAQCRASTCEPRPRPFLARLARKRMGSAITGPISGATNGLTIAGGTGRRRTAGCRIPTPADGPITSRPEAIRRAMAAFRSLQHELCRAANNLLLPGPDLLLWLPGLLLLRSAARLYFGGPRWGRGRW